MKNASRRSWIRSPFAALCILFLALVVSSCGFHLKITTQGDGSVTVTPQSDPYASGTQVTLTATAANGGSFLHWGEDLNGNLNPASITMDASHDVSAIFLPVSVASGQVTITGYPAATTAKGAMANFTVSLNLPAGKQYRVWIYYDTTTYKGSASTSGFTPSGVLVGTETGIVRGAIPITMDSSNNVTDYPAGSVTGWIIEIDTWDGVANTQLLKDTFYYEVTWQ